MQPIPYYIPQEYPNQMGNRLQQEPANNPPITNVYNPPITNVYNPPIANNPPYNPPIANNPPYNPPIANNPPIPPIPYNPPRLNEQPLDIRDLFKQPELTAEEIIANRDKNKPKPVVPADLAKKPDLKELTEAIKRNSRSPAQKDLAKDILRQEIVI